MLAEVFREIDSDAREKRNLPIRGETCGSRNYSREHILAEKVYRKKGYLKNNDTIVEALISKEQVQSEESEYFVERTFDGSLPGFIAAFLGGKKLSKKEAIQLKKMIGEFKE